MAQKIGPIDKQNLKFSLEELEKIAKKNSEEVTKKLPDKTILDEIEDVGTGFESMDLDLLNVSPSMKMTSESGAWLNLAMASKEQGKESSGENSKATERMETE